MKAAKIVLVAFSLTAHYSFCQTEKSDDKPIQSKSEKRYIHPKAEYFCVSAGWGFSSSNIKFANNYLENGFMMRGGSFIPEVRYEHGIKSNFFAEFGYLNIGHSFALVRVVNDIEISRVERVYRNNEFNLGIGYRLFTKHNYHIINFHTGFFTGFAKRDLMAHPDNFSRTINDMETNETFDVNFMVVDKRLLSFGPYIGISKELRLSKNIRFFVKYIHRFGLLSTFKASFNLTSNNISVPQDKGYLKMASGGSTVTAGFKFQILSKFYK